VSAARQRRSLALAASNGAEAHQLRRYVLGQAVVLGVLSAAIAVVAGVLLTLAGLTWWQAGHADFVIGPFEVSWPRVVGVFICAVAASMVAALLPAKGIARLDVVSVLAGRSGDRTVHRGLPAAGLVVMVLSGIALIWSVASGGQAGLGLSECLVVGGAVGLVLGCLMGSLRYWPSSATSAPTWSCPCDWPRGIRPGSDGARPPQSPPSWPPSPP
ncbi:MAG: ABC transporter permease, partial [Actinobacteria bacterium]|nr:ABC transporter permease [Actinomycetota bacterium]